MRWFQPIWKKQDARQTRSIHFPPKVWSENSKQIIETTFSGFLSKQSFGSHFLGSQPQSFLIQFSLKKNTFRKNPPCSVWRASESLTKLLGIDL